MNALRKLPGGAELEEWFGYLPSFHDAEVISLDLQRDPEPSTLRIYTWRSSDDVDESGYFHRDRHAIVSFIFSGIIQLEINEWNHQNVLAGIDVIEEAEGYVIALNGTFGVDGRIVSKLLNISVEPKY